MPLPVRLSAHIQGSATVIVQHDTGGFPRAAQNRLQIAGNANAAQQAAGRAGIAAGGKSGKIGMRLRCVQQPRKITTIHFFARNQGMRKPGDRIAAAQIKRINAKVPRRVIHHPFNRQVRLGATSPAIGIHRRGVGINPHRAQIGLWNIVDACQHFAKQLCLDRLPELRVIRPKIGHKVNAVSGDAQVRVKAHLRLGHQIAARVIG